MTSRSNITAGNLLLSAIPNVSPRKHALAEFQQHAQETANQQVADMNRLGQAAKKVRDCFDSLNEQLQAGNAFFYSSANSPDPLNLAFRRAVLVVGMSKGFDKCLKGKWGEHASVVLPYTRAIGQKSVEATVREVKDVVSKRDVAVNGFISSMRELEAALKVIDINFGKDDEQFRVNKDVYLSSTRDTIIQFQKWMKNFKTPDGMFPIGVKLEGFIDLLTGYKDIGPIQTTQTEVVKLLTLEGRKAASRLTIQWLETFAEFARGHDFFPDTTVKNILKTLFHLDELEKPLPEELKAEHRGALQKLKPLLSNTTISDYLETLQENGTLNCDDLEKLNRFIEPDVRRETVQDDSMPNRAEVRREIRSALEEWQTRINEQELLVKVSQLKDSSAKKVITYEITFFSERIQKEYNEWKGQIDDASSSTIDDILKSLASGDRQFVKPLASNRDILKITVGDSGYRVYYSISSSGKLVILTFGNKSSQNQDIDTAIARFNRLEA